MARIPVCCVLALLATTANGQMTNAKVISMKDDPKILELIKADTGEKFSLDEPGLKELKEKGVADANIVAMFAKKSKVTNQTLVDLTKAVVAAAEIGVGVQRPISIFRGVGSRTSKLRRGRPQSEPMDASAPW